MHSRPNIIIILTDDQGYGDLGCHGNPDIRTPNLDALHAESVRFTDFHVGTTCAPTRAGLLTGHYCNSTGVWHTIGGRSLLREDEWTLADALRGAGYATAHFGKWHLGDATPFRPFERGFDLSIYHGGGALANTPDHWGNDYFDDTYFVNGEPRAFKGYCTDVFFDEATKFIEQQEGPFFCYIATNAPHGPFNVEERYAAPYRDVAPDGDRAQFYGMVTCIDENVGRLRRKLTELGLTDNTIVAFMTDNGSGGGVTAAPLTGVVVEGPCNRNAGMRGIKGSPYEGGHRVPFFLACPALGLEGGRDIDALTSYVDFMPTLLDLSGIEVPPDRSFHGESLVPLLREQIAVPWRDERIIVSDTQRLPRPVKWRLSSVMQSRWRLVNGAELYNIGNDPSQRHDIAANHPAVVERLRAGYERWWDLVSEQFDRDVPFALGIDNRPVTLTTHDIRNESGNTAFSQSQVRKAHVVSGYWPVDIRRAGTYRIELRRWPREAGHTLSAGIEGDDIAWRRDCIAEKWHRIYSGGEAVDIRWAQLAVAGKTCQTELDGNQVGAVFELELPEGSTRLFAAFYDNRERTMSPYYLYIELIVSA